MAEPLARIGTAAAKMGLLALVGCVGWKALTLGLGEFYLESDAAFAVKLDSSNAAAVLSLARQTKDKSPALKAQARNAVRDLLSIRPTDGRLFRLLAQLDGDQPAPALWRWQAAVRLRPADAEARAWLADEAIARGDFAAALSHGDALLRVSPDRAKQLFPIFAHWLETGESTEALALTLQRLPPWRRSFVDYVAREGDANSLYALAQVVQSLRGSAAPVAEEEARPIANRLVHEGDFERAYLLWRSVQPPLKQASSMLYNGDFERPAGGGAFDWTLRSTPGVTVAVETDSAYANALSLRFGGVRVADIAVAQTLLLSPGNYHISGDTRLDDLRSARGLEWRVRCLGPSTRVIATGPALNGDRDWSGFDFLLHVPAADCPAQQLQLATRARTVVEQEVNGTAWFDNLRIEAQGVSAIPEAAR